MNRHLKNALLISIAVLILVTASFFLTEPTIPPAGPASFPWLREAIIALDAVAGLAQMTLAVVSSLMIVGIALYWAFTPSPDRPLGVRDPAKEDRVTDS